MKTLTHLNSSGEAQMVDVGHKMVTQRKAKATGIIHLSADAFQALQEGTSKKGDVIAVARIAAIAASKRTFELIPLCHLLPLESVEVQFTFDSNAHCVTCTASTSTTAKTGVEMEALVAVQVGLLTIYDMLKAIDKKMTITQVRLVEKSGGASGDFSNP